MNCWAMRYEAGEKYPRGRSRCPKCGHVLSAWELVPVLSWLGLRGRCKSCHEPISARYPLTELMGAAVFAGVFLKCGVSAETAELWILMGCLMLLSFIDYDTMLLPNGPMIVALVAWAAFLPAHEDWRSRAVGGILTALVVGAAVLTVSLIMDRVTKRESMGGGDIKLLALLALYFGPWQTLFLVIVSCLLGLLFAFALRAKAASRAGYVEEDKMICETAACAYRAGCDIYLTYYAEEIARFIKEGRIG